MMATQKTRRIKNFGTDVKCDVKCDVDVDYDVTLDVDVNPTWRQSRSNLVLMGELC